MDSQRLLAHVITSTRSNIEFLKSINHLSAEDAHLILSKLPVDAMGALSSQAQSLSITPAANSQGPPRRLAKALWDYNGDPQDLSFRAGDMIEIVHEANPDWFMGRLNGREALFPSNYIERPPPAAVASPANYSEKSNNYNTPYPSSTPAYSPGGYNQPPLAANYSSSPHNNYASPPPSNYSSPPPNMQYQPPPQQYNQYNPPPQQQVVVAPPAEKPAKSSSGLKNTLMHAGVGGLGMGAGSAIGSSLVHSIF